MNYASILVHHSFLLGHHIVSYEWQGEKRAPVIVPRSVLREFHREQGWPKRITLDGLPPMRYLPGSERYNSTFVRDAALYIRVDGSGFLSWAYWAVRSLILRSFWFVYERSILTLHVWGLADHRANCRPSWRDICWFQNQEHNGGGR